MNVSVRANVRTAEAGKIRRKRSIGGRLSRRRDYRPFSRWLGILGVAGYYYFLRGGAGELKDWVHPLVGLGFGGSLISIFARLGGGIFTKGADVGADLVGKVEAGIPEDDRATPPSSPTMSATMSAIAPAWRPICLKPTPSRLSLPCWPAPLLFSGEGAEYAVIYPLMLGGASIIASVAGCIFTRADRGGIITPFLPLTVIIDGILSKVNAGSPLMNILYRGLIVAGLVAGRIIYSGHRRRIRRQRRFKFLSALHLRHYRPFTNRCHGGHYAVLHRYRLCAGARRAKASETGHATNIIAGLAVSMKSCAAPIIVICITIAVSHYFAGLYGIAIAATSMLSMTGIIVALDAYGPITDNAGGIAEMADLPDEVRNVTDPLDAIGNTTKAVTKGYAIGSAGLAALVLFAGLHQRFGTDRQICRHYF